MGWTRTIGVLACLTLGAATSALAQQTCQLGNQSYPENTTVCSQGLELHCENGVWQNNSGARCNAPSGDYLGPRRPYQEKSDEPIPEYYKEKYPWLNLQ